MKTRFSIALCSAIALSFAAGSLASAQPTTRYYAEGNVPTPLEVARAMAGPKFVPKTKMRGLAVPAAQPAYTSETVVAITDTNISNDSPIDTATYVSKATSRTRANGTATNSGVLAMAVPFAFDSALLTPAASPMLDSVAEGIKLLGDGSKIVIEGHTDSVGNSLYNKKLSKSRAQAVKQYFVVKHGIRPSALTTAGKGSREPLSGMTPEANENRRVQFRLS
jgi:outer membrane protein OmpA-like peptidoglycan-associated protein